MSIGTNRSIVVTLAAATSGFQQQMQQAARQTQSFSQMVNTVKPNMQQFNSIIDQNAKTFQASINPIRETGNALANNSKQIQAVAGQTESFTSKIKSNILSIGIAASGIVGLVTQFTRLQKVQLSAEAAQVKAGKATNKVEDIQRALNKMIAAGKQGTAEYTAKVADLKLAQDTAAIATERATIVQQQANEATANFAVDILPNVIAVSASVTQVMQGFGLSLTKLKGGITSLGTSLSDITTPLADTGTMGLLAGSAISKLNVASNAAVGGVSTLRTALITLGSAIATVVAIPAAGIFAGNLLGNTFKEFHEIGDLVRKQQLAWLKVFGATDAQVKTFNDTMNEINKTLGVYVPNVETAVQKTAELAAAEAKLNEALKDPALKSHQTHIANAAKETVKLAQAKVDDLKATENLDAGMLTLGKNIKVYADNTKTWTTDTLLASVAGGKYGEELLKIGGVIPENIKGLQQQDKTLANLPERWKTAATFVQLFGDKTKVATASMEKYNATHIPMITGMTALEQALTDGQVKFQDFIQTTELGVVTNSRYREGLMGFVGGFIQLPPHIKLTTSTLEQMTQAIIEGENAADILADVINKNLAPALSSFSSLLGAENNKDFGKAWKNIDFGSIPKSVRGDFKDMFKEMRDAGERGREIATALNMVFVAIATGSKKVENSDIRKVFKEINNDLDRLGKINKNAKGLSNLFEPLEKLKGKKLEDFILKFGDSLNLLKTAMADNWVDPSEKVAILQQYGIDAGLSAEKIAKLGEKMGLTKEQIALLTTNTQGAVDPMNQFGISLTGTGEAAKSMVTIMSQMSASMVTSVGEAAKFIVPIFKANIPNAMGEMISKIGPHVTTINTYFTKTVPTALETSTSSFEDFSEAVGKEMAAAVAKAKPHVTTLNTYFKTTIKGAVDAATQALKSFKTALDNIPSNTTKTITFRFRTEGRAPTGQQGAYGGSSDSSDFQNSDTAYLPVRRSNSGLSGGSSGGQNITIPVSLHISGNEIINERTLIRYVKKRMGSDIPSMY